MLTNVFEQLDIWISEENRCAIQEGSLVTPAFCIKLLGQMALFEANIQLHLAATTDVDAILDTRHAIIMKFDELLRKQGQHLDFDARTIWMPEETQYVEIFSGKNFVVTVAQVEYVLISKAAKASEKNKLLITEYLAEGPTPLFLKLAKKYNVELEWFIK